MLILKGLYAIYSLINAYFYATLISFIQATMQYGAIDEHGNPRSHGLRTTQKWSIVAAVFGIFLEVVAMVVFAPFAGIPGSHQVRSIINQ